MLQSKPVHQHYVSVLAATGVLGCNCSVLWRKGVSIVLSLTWVLPQTVPSLYLSSLGLTKSSEAPQLQFLLPVMKHDTQKREHWLHFCLSVLGSGICDSPPQGHWLSAGIPWNSLPSREAAALYLSKKWRCTFWVCSMQYILSILSLLHFNMQKIDVLGA